MSQCQLDHSQEDVRKKFESQKEFLPKEMMQLFQSFFSKEHPQHILNELFHLLKKYDLSSTEEKKKRNQQLLLLFNHL
jgi:citrate synthase